MVSQSPRSSPSIVGKRKRSPWSTGGGGGSRSAHLPLNSINPLSHPPSTLLQLNAAGLPETSELPSQTIPGFPHRGLDTGALSDGPESEDGGGDEQGHDDEGPAAAGGTKKTNKESKPLEAAYDDGHLGVLLRAIHQFLDQGHVSRAARAYGLVLQLRPRVGGAPVDVRHHGLWALGAEILMREGERPTRRGVGPEDEHGQTAAYVGEDGSHGRPGRWGSAANLARVRAYLETLIQQHPYDYRRPHAVCAVDFWLALLGCEVYSAHAEHAAGLARVADGKDEEAEDDGLPPWDGQDDEDEHGWRDARRRERLRQRALAAVTDVARRMDGLMQDLPYSRNWYYLRLRAMVSLYVADLLVPVAETDPEAVVQAYKAREMEQQTARGYLRKMVENGGELDHVTRAILDPDHDDEEEDDDDDDEKPESRFEMLRDTSLPIREI